METTNNNIAIDFKKFEKIEDIIFLDEPILTHLKLGQKDYLLYLVETKDSIDSYLLFEVSEENIYEYLVGKVSLRTVILNNDNINYLVDQNFEGEVIEIKPCFSNYIPEIFLPSENSFIKYEPTKESYYFAFIQHYHKIFYLNELRKDAFYLKLSAINQKYSDTIGLTELVNDFLANVSGSFKSFLKSDFYNEFKGIFTDEQRLNRTFYQILPDLDFRLVDLKFSSFEVGLSVDKIMKSSIENKIVKDWATNVGFKYKRIVLDKDYDEETVSKIVELYNEKDRRKIFEPIFQITENPNYKLQIKDSKNSVYSTLRVRDKSVRERIAPPKILLENNSQKEWELLQVVTVHDKSSKKKSIKLDQNSLFNPVEETDRTLTNAFFESIGCVMADPINLKVVISAQGNQIIFTTTYENGNFRAINENGNLDEGLKDIASQVYNYKLNFEKQ